jgi:antitoxin (DNA-binding transcriptional repressor) of toxin-antitoxin stability system
MKVSAQYAEAHFPDLLEAASNGIEVEIAIPEKPSLKLVRVYSAPTPKPTGRRILGAGRGEMRPVSDEEWQSMKREMEGQMLRNPLITTGEV